MLVRELLFIYLPTLFTSKFNILEFLWIRVVLFVKKCLVECKLNSDAFCYVCAQLIFAKKRRPISASLKTAYLHYFGFSVSKQDKKWMPHVFCESCRITLICWASGEKVYFKFGSPIFWRKSSNHKNDCYFCMKNTTGFN